MGDFLIFDLLGNYGFHFYADFPRPTTTFTVGVEKRSSADYYLDNRTRTPAFLFQYTLSGTGTVILNGKRHTVSRGQAFFLRFPEDTVYCFDEAKNEAPWHFIWILYTDKTYESYYAAITQRSGNILELAENSRSITALAELYRAAREDRIRTPFDAQSLFTQFLCMLCNDCIYPETKHSALVQKALHILETEYAALDGIDRLSQRLCVTHSHLTRVFTEETGSTPLACLTRIRLQHAVNLLSRTNDSVEQIARSCGFSCGNYFAKTFRRHMGLSPLAYRNSTSSIAYENIRI